MHIVLTALAEQHPQILLQILLILTKERDHYRDRWWHLSQLRARDLLKTSHNKQSRELHYLNDEEQHNNRHKSYSCDAITIYNRRN